jgi:maltooligosyltrehalose trehalohydrolase
MCVLLSPFTPMLFMGEEYGEAAPFQFFSDHIDEEIAIATREGRRREFAGFAEFAGEEVPDPQDPETFRRSRLDWSEPGREPHARVLAWYRDLMALRREVPDLRDPRLDRVELSWGDGHLAMRRGGHLVLVNLAEVSWQCDTEGSVVLSWDADVKAQDGHVEVPARSAVVVRIDEGSAT